MNKLAFVIVLAALAAPLAQAQVQHSATSAWVTVDNFSLLNQTQAITTPTPIYAPPMAGLYRVSYYIEAVGTTLTMPPPATDSVCLTVSWTDDSGQAQYPIGFSICAASSLGNNGAPYLTGTGNVIVFRSKATPINITAFASSNSGIPATTYNVTGTIERWTTSTN
jgi:hypothetical protein